MTHPPEYTRLSNGTLKRNDGAVTDYTQPYWGVDGKSTIEDQIYNVGQFIGDNGKTKVDTVLHYAVGDTLLEIGCAPGELLRRATEDGFRCVGLEPCAGHVEFIQQHSGSKVVCETLEDYDTDRTFDTIVALDVLEHVVDPEAFIDRCRDLLAPNGRIILMTPVIGEGVPWRDCDFHPEHLHLFDIDHINQWLKPIALELWHPGHMTIICE